MRITYFKKGASPKMVEISAPGIRYKRHCASKGTETVAVIISNELTSDYKTFKSIGTRGYNRIYVIDA